MKLAIAMAALVLSLIPAIATAQERGGDAALGALSGAVVFGPIGAVAGAIVGYTAGPSIARSWGFRQSRPARQAKKSPRAETRVSRADNPPAPTNQASPPTAAPSPAPPLLAKSASTAPPVQGLE